MSWAAKRRLMYITGIVIVFLGVVVFPLTWSWYQSLPPNCPSGTMRAAGDSSGPCDILDESRLQPHAVLWARAFLVRPGVYDAIAYIQNPNPNAGVLFAPYQFSFYDDQNVLVEQKTGTTYIMPQSVTPVFISDIETGNRTIAHTYFQLGSPLTWQTLSNTTIGISVDNKNSSDLTSAPRVSATAHNTTVSDRTNLTFIAVLFDTAGNAIAASETTIPRLAAEESAGLVFTWPSPLSEAIGRIDIMPIAPPAKTR